MQDAYQYIRLYSPYDNIRPQDYPAMLLTASLHDSRVPYWESAKYVAALRSILSRGEAVFPQPLLLTNLEAGGHNASTQASTRLSDLVMKMAFLVNNLGNDSDLLA